MKIMILVNKNFEYRGYADGVESRADSTSHLICIGGHNVDDNAHDRFFPSAEYTLEADSGIHHIKEYCINYLFAEDENSSNSERKYQLVRKLLGSLPEEAPPDLIISVSTSESTDKVQDDKEGGTVNGCVFMGNKFFATDCREYDIPPKRSNLDVIEFLDNALPFENFYTKVIPLKRTLADGMIDLPHSPAKDLMCYADPDYTSLGVVNVMCYDSYPIADKFTYGEFLNSKYNHYIPEGLETTHSVIRMAVQTKDNKNLIPVLFVSPIVDRFLSFSEDVRDEQNYNGSFNAGVAVANLLENIRNDLPITND